MTNSIDLATARPVRLAGHDFHVAPRDDGHLPTNEIGRQSREPIELPVSPAVFDLHILVLNITTVS